MNPSDRLPTLFIPHGGGPCFFIRPEDLPPGMPKNVWDPMAGFLRGIAAGLGQRPRAVLVISAHWLTPRPTLGIASQHTLYYDYYGFPPYTYHLTYPAAGAPDLAAQAGALFAAAGIGYDTDATRGLDHGVFVPFKLIFPDADIPIVPLSLRQDLDASAHLAIGAALAPLRDQGVLIVGSGMSFHNMRAMMTRTGGPDSVIFDRWLDAAATAPVAADRNQALAHWQSAPSARAAHPEAEHLLPLMVAAGAAGADVGLRTYRDRLGDMAMSAFAFGVEPAQNRA